MKPKYSDITVKLIGEDDNAFSILGRVVAALRRSGVERSEIDKFLGEAQSSDYDNLLRITMKWVQVE